MSWRKYFVKSPKKVEFCEEVQLFKDAVDAVLGGEKAYKIQELKGTISVAAFTLAEQDHLHEYIDKGIRERKLSLLRVELHKVLTGNETVSDLREYIDTLGQVSGKNKVLSGSKPSFQISQSQFDILAAQKKEHQEWLMRQQYATQQKYLDAAGVGPSILDKVSQLK